MTTEEFIQAHRTADVRSLALQGKRFPGVDMPFALDQIAGWQTARTKLPAWAATDGIVYPPHLSMEQSSSEVTARYKAELARRIAADDRALLVDITGGFGVDFSYMARGFDRSVYVERQERLCEAARHNFPLLGLNGAEVVCGDGVEHLQQLERASLIFIDPARRDSHGGKTVAIGDCTPDLTAILDTLLSKTRHVVVKLSPMLDWHKAVDDLRRKVSEVHILSVGNECKELLLVVGREVQGTVSVCCVNNDETFVYDYSDAGQPLSAVANASFSTLEDILSAPGQLCLYEPNASVMKAGCFAELSERYGMAPLSANSHLFISDVWHAQFPGRRFAVEAVTTMNRKSLASALGGLTQTNITVRNFPLTVAELRRRIRLREGGDTYLFATTLADGERCIFRCRKMQ